MLDTYSKGGHAAARPAAFSFPRDFLDNRFVYAVVSSRARGLTIGINVNPDARCNFDCLYCEVDRSKKPAETSLDVEVMADELRHTLQLVQRGKLHLRPAYQSAPAELLQLRHVALSGDGEPTLAENFTEVVEAVIHLRAVGEVPFFKMVLLTNATGLDRAQVQRGLAHFTRADEIWAKLDGGTQDYLERLARPKDLKLDKILANILSVARQRPVVIQSLFPSINGEDPSDREIMEYAQRLRELREAGAEISLVQIYSANRPAVRSECSHLSLRTLSHIAQTVRQVSGLHAEVF